MSDPGTFVAGMFVGIMLTLAFLLCMVFAYDVGKKEAKK